MTHSVHLKDAPSRPRLPTGTRQTQIIETVLRLAAQHSPGQITMQEIADTIGITQGALFRHFVNKEAIWLAAIEWVEKDLLMTLETVASTAGTPFIGLQCVFFSHVDYVAERPGVPRLIFHELQQPTDSPTKAAVRKMLQRYRQLVTGLIEAANAGHERGQSVDANAATTLFIGSIQGLVMQSMLSDDTTTMRTLATQVFPLLQRTLKSPKESI